MSAFMQRLADGPAWASDREAAGSHAWPGLRGQPAGEASPVRVLLVCGFHPPSGVKLAEVARLRGVHPKSAHRWHHEGRLPVAVDMLSSGTIIVREPVKASGRTAVWNARQQVELLAAIVR
jgi:hypothetical protein